MERWYLLITEKFLFWTFWRLKTRYFFQPKSWWKDDIYLVFLNFPVYFRTWKIWLFLRWTCCSLQIISLKLINELFWIFYPYSLLKMTPHKSTPLCFYAKIFIFLIKFVFQNLQPLLKKRGFKLWLTSTW